MIRNDTQRGLSGFACQYNCSNTLDKLLELCYFCRQVGWKLRKWFLKRAERSRQRAADLLIEEPHTLRTSLSFRLLNSCEKAVIWRIVDSCSETRTCYFCVDQILTLENACQSPSITGRILGIVATPMV